jgi:hypothetical protein
VWKLSRILLLILVACWVGAFNSRIASLRCVQGSMSPDARSALGQQWSFRQISIDTYSNPRSWHDAKAAMVPALCQEFRADQICSYICCQSCLCPVGAVKHRRHAFFLHGFQEFNFLFDPATRSRQDLLHWSRIMHTAWKINGTGKTRLAYFLSLANGVKSFFPDIGPEQYRR